jgi:predicted RNase H-like nuclease (RuvC/YqgF family)
MVTSEIEYSNAKSLVSQYEKANKEKSKKKKKHYTINSDGQRVDKDNNVIVSAMSRVHNQLDRIRAILQCLASSQTEQARNEIEKLNDECQAHALEIKHRNLTEKEVSEMNPIARAKYDMEKEQKRSTERLDYQTRKIAAMEKFEKDGGSLVDFTFNVAGSCAAPYQPSDSDSDDE